jgi:hypothetical protein
MFIAHEPAAPSAPAAGDTTHTPGWALSIADCVHVFGGTTFTYQAYRDRFHPNRSESAASQAWGRMLRAAKEAGLPFTNQNGTVTLATGALELIGAHIDAHNTEAPFDVAGPLEAPPPPPLAPAPKAPAKMATKSKKKKPITPTCAGCGKPCVGEVRLVGIANNAPTCSERCYQREYGRARRAAGFRRPRKKGETTSEKVVETIESAEDTSMSTAEKMPISTVEKPVTTAMASVTPAPAPPIAPAGHVAVIVMPTSDAATILSSIFGRAP